MMETPAPPPPAEARPLPLPLPSLDQQVTVQHLMDCASLDRQERDRRMLGIITGHLGLRAGYLELYGGNLNEVDCKMIGISVDILNRHDELRNDRIYAYYKAIGDEFLAPRTEPRAGFGSNEISQPLLRAILETVLEYRTSNRPIDGKTAALLYLLPKTFEVDDISFVRDELIGRMLGPAVSPDLAMTDTNARVISKYLWPRVWEAGHENGRTVSPSEAVMAAWVTERYREVLERMPPNDPYFVFYQQELPLLVHPVPILPSAQGALLLTGKEVVERARETGTALFDAGVWLGEAGKTVAQVAQAGVQKGAEAVFRAATSDLAQRAEKALRNEVEKRLLRESQIQVEAGMPSEELSLTQPTLVRLEEQTGQGIEFMVDARTEGNRTEVRLVDPGLGYISFHPVRDMAVNPLNEEIYAVCITRDPDGNPQYLPYNRRTRHLPRVQLINTRVEGVNVPILSFVYPEGTDPDIAPLEDDDPRKLCTGFDRGYVEGTPFHPAIARAVFKPDEIVQLDILGDKTLELYIPPSKAALRHEVVLIDGQGNQYKITRVPTRVWQGGGFAESSEFSRLKQEYHLGGSDNIYHLRFIASGERPELVTDEMAGRAAAIGEVFIIERGGGRKELVAIDRSRQPGNKAFALGIGFSSPLSEILEERILSSAREVTAKATAKLLETNLEKRRKAFGEVFEITVDGMYFRIVWDPDQNRPVVYDESGGKRDIARFESATEDTLEKNYGPIHQLNPIGSEGNKPGIAQQFGFSVLTNTAGEQKLEAVIAPRPNSPLRHPSVVLYEMMEGEERRIRCFVIDPAAANNCQEEDPIPVERLPSVDYQQIIRGWRDHTSTGYYSAGSEAAGVAIGSMLGDGRQAELVITRQPVTDKKGKTRSSFAAYDITTEKSMKLHPVGKGATTMFARTDLLNIPAVAESQMVKSKLMDPKNQVYAVAIKRYPRDPRKRFASPILQEAMLAVDALFHRDYIAQVIIIEDHQTKELVCIVRDSSFNPNFPVGSIVNTGTGLRPIREDDQELVVGIRERGAQVREKRKKLAAKVIPAVASTAVFTAAQLLTPYKPYTTAEVEAQTRVVPMVSIDRTDEGVTKKVVGYDLVTVPRHSVKVLPGVEQAIAYPEKGYQLPARTTTAQDPNHFIPAGVGIRLDIDNFEGEKNALYGSQRPVPYLERTATETAGATQFVRYLTNPDGSYPDFGKMQDGSPVKVLDEGGKLILDNNPDKPIYRTPFRSDDKGQPVPQFLILRTGEIVGWTRSSDPNNYQQIELVKPGQKVFFAKDIKTKEQFDDMRAGFGNDGIFDSTTYTLQDPAWGLNIITENDKGILIYTNAAGKTVYVDFGVDAEGNQLVAQATSFVYGNQNIYAIAAHDGLPTIYVLENGIFLGAGDGKPEELGKARFRGDFDPKKQFKEEINIRELSRSHGRRPEDLGRTQFLAEILQRTKATEVSLADYLYEPQVLVTKDGGYLVGQKDIKMTIDLANFGGVLNVKPGYTASVYRYFERGKDGKEVATDRFFIVNPASGKLEVVAIGEGPKYILIQNLLVASRPQTTLQSGGVIGGGVVGDTESVWALVDGNLQKGQPVRVVNNERLQDGVIEVWLPRNGGEYYLVAQKTAFTFSWGTGKGKTIYQLFATSEQTKRQPVDSLANLTNPTLVRDQIIYYDSSGEIRAYTIGPIDGEVMGVDKSPVKLEAPNVFVGQDGKYYYYGPRGFNENVQPVSFNQLPDLSDLKEGNLRLNSQGKSLVSAQFTLSESLKASGGQASLVAIDRNSKIIEANASNQFEAGGFSQEMLLLVSLDEINKLISDHKLTYDDKIWVASQAGGSAAFWTYVPGLQEYSIREAVVQAAKGDPSSKRYIEALANRVGFASSTGPFKVDTVKLNRYLLTNNRMSKSEYYYDAYGRLHFKTSTFDIAGLVQEIYKGQHLSPPMLNALNESIADGMSFLIEDGRKLFIQAVPDVRGQPIVTVQTENSTIPLQKLQERIKTVISAFEQDQLSSIVPPARGATYGISTPARDKTQRLAAQKAQTRFVRQQARTFNQGRGRI